MQFYRLIDHNSMFLQVKFCDSGISRKKQLPGVGNEVISLDFKVF